MKKNILISAYAISPARGSEYAAAWNTVVNLAGQHRLWVLFGMSDDHMGDTQTLTHYIKCNPIPNVTFIEVKGGRIANTINLLNKAGFGWFFYFAYYIWQKRAFQAAQAVINNNEIDVVHQLGPIGYREPGFLNKLNKPMVWGPVGGMKIMERKFLSMLPPKAKIKFVTKNYINRYQLRAGRVSAAFKQADVIIAATIAGQNEIRRRFGRESYYLPEQGIVNQFSINLNKFKNIKQQVRLVWSGSLIERKNLKMCLDALAGVKQNNWVLDVLGDGPLRKSLEQRAAENGLTGNVYFHGHLPRTNAISIMAAAHLHIITSIGEDNPAVIFEAMSNGVPTLTIDHCGMGDVICTKCGVKILPDDYHKMVKKMSFVISDLLISTKILEDLAQTTLHCADEHKWDKRLKKLNYIYDKAMAVHHKNIPLLKEVEYNSH